MATPSAPYHARIHSRLEEIPASEWNELINSDNPFLRHAFLNALEQHQCVGEEYGWYPCHISIRDDTGHLVAAMPMYIKTNYYGEFVFDWNWDSAYRQSGLDYYPKLVISIPYTPATGPRLLVSGNEEEREKLRQLLVAQALRVAEDNRFSSVHWLFTDDTETAFFRRQGMAIRKGCNFHWHNNDYTDFPDFLSTFTSKKRKNVKRERRRVAEQGIEVEVFQANAISDDLLSHFHDFYVGTFDKKSGLATLNLPFFKSVRDALGDDMVLVMAFSKEAADRKPVAGALFFQGGDELFGRYWGCAEEFHSLHFETCYYQGLEYAIKNGLNKLDPGVQGEHKIPRGFLPTPTWSAHWIASPEFRPLIKQYCQHEEDAMHDHCQNLMQLSPYREDARPPFSGTKSGDSPTIPTATPPGACKEP